MDVNAPTKPGAATARGAQGKAETTAPPTKGAKTKGAKPPRAKRGRTLTVGPGVIAMVTGLFLLVGGWAAVATTMLLFGDPLSARLVAQMSDMQYAYEQKLVVFRAQLDRFARQAVNERGGIEGRLADLMIRQAALEARQAMLISLAEQTRLPEHAGPQRGAAAPARSSFAMLDATHSPEARADHIAGSISNVEQLQARTLTGFMRQSENVATQFRNAFAFVGLNADQFVPQAAPPARLPPGLRAPAAPPPSDDQFEQGLAQARRTLSLLGRLRTAASTVPFIRPMAEDGQIVTSSFGTRSDPFTGEPRFHAGLDFRAAEGAPVRAGGSGVVLSAGVGGGYGNLVQIDHGNGIITRYAHLSAILVQPGQPVSGGMVVGLVGSTGRSTGPHLHYETRVNDEPRDPNRFIEAGQRILVSRR
jgi:murein DD-endopeptidase MepM/ murein hydrolase activator NlpD